MSDDRDYAFWMRQSQRRVRWWGWAKYYVRKAADKLVDWADLKRSER